MEGGDEAPSNQKNLLLAGNERAVIRVQQLPASPAKLGGALAQKFIIDLAKLS